MAYQEHHEFEVPEDTGVRIWRYMNFTKFVSMLDSSSLWFSRVDQLDDPFEASWLPYVPVENRKTGDVTETFKHNLGFREFSVDRTAVNCWHMNEHESAAMWRLYTATDQGIAVQSTFADLTACFADCRPFVSVGIVAYRDYDRHLFTDSNGFHAFLHKRISFEHEREVRAIVWPLGGEDPDSSPIPTDGLSLRVDLATLIRGVHVSPMAPAWIRDLTEGILRRYHIEAEVQRSRLMDSPLF